MSGIELLERLHQQGSVVPIVMMTTEGQPELIERAKSLGAKGVGEVTAQLYADDPKMDNLFYHASECDMPVTIHISPRMGYTYGMVDDLGLPRLEKMLKKHKKLKILGHSQASWAELSADVKEEYRSGYPTGKVIDGRIAELAAEHLADLDLSYAITVHKSQGSEFKAVIIPTMGIVPNLAYRNLLYTAVTRAKDMLITVGSGDLIYKMTQNDKKAKRYSALSHFLKAEF
jgi:CheY-like chemotaxis protein